MRVFHVRIGAAAKAFAKPETTCQRLALWMRGYRPNDIGPCWGKASSLNGAAE